MEKKQKINIIGSGVIGLTTAVYLQNKGFEVTIYTKEMPSETTSAVAAAIWFPYNVSPKEKVSLWSKFTYQYFSKLALNSRSGVQFVPVTIIEKTMEDCWWLEAIPNQNYTKIPFKDLPLGYNIGFKVNIPFIESSVFLDFLLQKFLMNGGKIIQKEIMSFAELDAEIPIVNCSGLGAIELCEDEELFPVKGQIVTVPKQAKINSLIVNYNIDTKGEELIYIIVRNNDIVLGGTSVNGNFDKTIDNEVSTKIIERCKGILPNLKNTNIIKEKVGLRPKRLSIRLEKEGNIIHNYGHGGAGFTVSWGCADSVYNMLL